MGDFLNGLLENSSFPVLTAFVLGLMTAISPCPLATNITAVGFIGKDIRARSRVFINGLVYTLGRAFAYTSLAFIIFIGADQLKLSGWFQQNSEKFVGPLLLIIGILMLDLFSFGLPGVNALTGWFKKKETNSYLDVFLLGVLFALAFCPYSGVLYFGMLIPITLGSASGLFLPVVFAIATGIPVIIFAWLLAYAVSGVGKLYNSLKAFEVWFRRVMAVIFILIGLYYLLRVYL